jgi:hypothetical protein
MKERGKYFRRLPRMVWNSRKDCRIIVRKKIFSPVLKPAQELGNVAQVGKIMGASPHRPPARG